MPTREEMIEALKKTKQGGPSREEMVAALKNGKAPQAQAPSWLDKDFGPTLPFVGHQEFRPRQVIQSTANQLPGAGALIGGGIASIPGAAFGGSIGQSAKNAIEQNILDKPKTAGELALGPAQGAVDGLTQEMTGQILNKAIAPVGSYMYKSGLKNLDKIGARYGKEPVSDLLMKNDIWGSAKGIQTQMDTLADKLLLEKQGILQRATANGAEVDMNAAVKRAQDVVDRMKYINDPEQKAAIDALQSRIDTYRSTNAKNAEQVLRELPFTKEQKILVPQVDLPAYQANGAIKHEYDISGRTGVPSGATGMEYYSPTKAGARDLSREASDGVVNNPLDEIIGLPRSMQEQTVLSPSKATVMDTTERIPGPNPIQVDAWKTTGAKKIGDAAYKDLAQSNEGRGFQKALNGGQRDAVEASVSKYLGPDEAQALSEKNEGLGKILTSQERAQMDAEMEAAKNAVTPVDAMTYAMTGGQGAFLKKMADIAKMTGPRTGGGLALKKLSTTGLPGYLARDAEPSAPIETQAPWLDMMNQYQLRGN